MRRSLHLIFIGLKWLIAAVILLEIFCFLVITVSNYLIYGQVRDADPVRYDPYTLFVGEKAPRPTTNNPSGPDRQKYTTIWLFGGSTMKGINGNDDKTIPSFLARDLNQSGPLPSYLINFGEPSFNSLMESKYLQKALIEQPVYPDIIIFYDGANDCAYFAQNRTPDAHLGYRRLKGLIESYHHSFFGILKPLNAAMYASFTYEFYSKLRQGVIPLSPEDPQLLKFVDTVEKRYDYINKTAEYFGARFLLIWQPFWWVEIGQVLPEVKKREEVNLPKKMAVRHNFVTINRALADRLKNKPYFTDFRNILVPRTQPVYTEDGIHLLEIGDEMVAGQIARYLKAQGPPTAARGGSFR